MIPIVLHVLLICTNWTWVNKIIFYLLNWPIISANRSRKLQFLNDPTTNTKPHLNRNPQHLLGIFQNCKVIACKTNKQAQMKTMVNMELKWMWQPRINLTNISESIIRAKNIYLPNQRKRTNIEAVVVDASLYFFFRTVVTWLLDLVATPSTSVFVEQYKVKKKRKRCTHYQNHLPKLLPPLAPCTAYVYIFNLIVMHHQSWNFDVQKKEFKPKKYKNLWLSLELIINCNNPIVLKLAIHKYIFYELIILSI